MATTKNKVTTLPGDPNNPSKVTKLPGDPNTPTKANNLLLDANTPRGVTRYTNNAAVQPTQAPTTTAPSNTPTARNTNGTAGVTRGWTVDDVAAMSEADRNAIMTGGTTRGWTVDDVAAMSEDERIATMADSMRKSGKTTFTDEEIAAMTPEELSAAWQVADPDTQTKLHTAKANLLGSTHNYNASTGRWTPKLTDEAIAAMSPDELSAAWLTADPATREKLHAAKASILGPTHTYDSASGTWTPRNKYTAEEIAKMTPSERQAAWMGATDASRDLLHDANVRDLSPTHNYNAMTGEWTHKTPADFVSTNPEPYTAEDIREMAGYTYDEDKIRKMFDSATKREYEGKEAANRAAQNDYANTIGGYINTLSDTMRQSLNKAVATGGSRGLAAAEAMQAAQDASMKSTETATKLSQERMQLGYDKAEAYAQNAIDAEELGYTRRKTAMDQGLNLSSVDIQGYAAEQGKLGQYWYGYPAAQENTKASMYASDKAFDQGVYTANKQYDSDIYTANKQYDSDIYKTNRDYEVGMASADNNRLGILLGILQSNNVSAEGRAELEKILGWESGTLQASPTGGSGGGYGGGYSGSGRSGGYGSSGSYSSGSSFTDAFTNNSSFNSTVDAVANNALLDGDKYGYANALEVGGRSSYTAGVEGYSGAFDAIYDKTLSMTKSDFVKWGKENLPGVTSERLEEHYDYWRPSYSSSERTGMTKVGSAYQTKDSGRHH